MNFTFAKRIFALILVLSLVFSLSACRKQPYINPYEGMVSVKNGAGGEMWVPLYEGIEASALSSDEFSLDGAFIEYNGLDYNALRGIDVSEHQQEIDWNAVKNDGIEFAIIRAGYRGYSEGKLSEDAFFRRNIEGALAAGLKVGVYFFSQAIDTVEAIEEACFLIELIDGYDISLPVFFDWENIGQGENARTDNVDGETITSSCIAFAQTVKAAGYKPGVYFYRSLGYLSYDLDKISDLVLWVGAVGDYPDFYYKHSIWQYSYTGTVQGVPGECDLNILFEDIPSDGALKTLPPAPSIVPGELPPPEVSTSLG